MPILKDFKFHSPDSLSQALAILEKAESPMLLAGGTFVLNTLKKSSRYPTDVISLKKVSELKGIKTQDNELWIGSMTRIDELAGSKLISDAFSCLKEAALKLGATPIRNMATIGGNIASRFYWVDLPAVLIALGARLEVALDGDKRLVGLTDFLTEKQHKKAILTGIILPLEKRDARYFRHTRTVQEVDAPYLGLAFSYVDKNMRPSNIRAVVNTTLSFPVFLKRAASMLEGTGYQKAAFEDIRAAVLQDVSITKLDQHRIQLLCADMEIVLASLKKKYA